MTDDDRHQPGHQLGTAYKLTNPEESREFYQGWAEGYDAEVASNEYITPRRCAEALARHAAAPWAPTMDLGCDTGISGLALKAARFECIDGYDFSQAMARVARIGAGGANGARLREASTTTTRSHKASRPMERSVRASGCGTATSVWGPCFRSSARGLPRS